MHVRFFTLHSTRNTSVGTASLNNLRTSQEPFS